MPQRLSDMDNIAIAILDAIPSPILVVDEDVKIIAYNLAASQILGQNPELVLRRRAGDILHCLHASKTPEGCGRSQICQDCPVRNSVNASIQGQRVVRRKARMEMVRQGNLVESYLMVTTAPLTHLDHHLVLLILEDISEIMELKSILPICMHCKRIRDDQQYWQSVERYFKDHLDLDFSHSLCPQCTQEFYPEYSKKE